MGFIASVVSGKGAVGRAANGIAVYFNNVSIVKL
jgi:hypothetical protein